MTGKYTVEVRRNLYYLYNPEGGKVGIYAFWKERDKIYKLCAYLNHMLEELHYE